VLDGVTTGAPIANNGVVVVEDDGALTLKGAIANRGTIALDSTGDTTQLLIDGAVTLSGGGMVTLMDNAVNLIAGVAAGGGTLTNVNDTIAGAGEISGPGLTIVNQAKGVIDATGVVNPLVIGIGVRVANAGLLESTSKWGLMIENTAVTNTGAVEAAATNSLVELVDGTTITGGKVSTVKGSTMEAAVGASAITGAVTNAGTLGVELADLTITGAVANTGTLDANGGALTIDGAVTGNGNATIEGGGTIEFGATDGKIAENVTFSNAGNGDSILRFDQAVTTTATSLYSGVISGFTGSSDKIDLAGLTFEGDTTVHAAKSGSNTILTVTEGVDKVSLAFAGAGYAFTISADSGTGTLIVDPPALSGIDLSAPAQAFDSFGLGGLGFGAGATDRLAASAFPTPNLSHG
jgi:hypothetical protein